MSQTIDDVMDWVNQEAKLALSDPKQAVHVFWDTFGPGGRLHPRAFLESQGHLVIEALLLVAIIYLVVHSRNPPASKDTLTEKVRVFIPLAGACVPARASRWCHTLQIVLDVPCIVERLGYHQFTQVIESMSEHTVIGRGIYSTRAAEWIVGLPGLCNRT